ncbi:MAG: universal stress protein [Streptosporangiaceae bacterium]|jgi:nucleotide-binding universal stress UspA family protein|nr:universal stress protein UspA [Actinomycetota bacterium]
MTYRIVVGFEGSPHSSAALRWALDEAASHSGEVTAVFCWQMPFLSFPGAFDREELENTYKDFLVKAASEVAPSPKVPLRTVVAEGDTTESLIAAAQQCAANLLVLGIRGRSHFPGLLLGSVSQGCAASAPCPVTLVKPTDEL